MYLDIINKKAWGHPRQDGLPQDVQDELDCGQADAGLAECWPNWVNITVPVVCSVSLVLVLVLLYLIKPRAPASLQRQRTRADPQPGRYVSSPDSIIMKPSELVNGVANQALEIRSTDEITRTDDVALSNMNGSVAHVDLHGISPANEQTVQF